VAGTPLAEMYPEIASAHINSIHHQAIKDLGRDLVVEAVAVPDGIVEAVRWRGPSYVFGMQWHPEFLAHADAARAPARRPADPAHDFLAAVRRRNDKN
jgi:putative glutamine amidotransferase